MARVLRKLESSRQHHLGAVTADQLLTGAGLLRPGPMSMVRIGVIGAGFMAETHVEAYGDIDDAAVSSGVT